MSIKEVMKPYQAPMLPSVDYKKIDEEDTSFIAFSLIDLEYDTLKSCSNFLQELKHVLIAEKLVQFHEIMLAYLCAYLGTVTTVHTVKKAAKLEHAIIELIKHQAHAAFKQFSQYPINSTVKSHEQKIANLEKLRQKAPGSIIVQTMRLGREITDILEELKSEVTSLYSQKQTELFCSQDTLTKLMLLMSSQKCPEWREELDGLSDNYVINQLAIQVGWLMGYFSHLDKKSPDETKYFDYGLPMVSLYREHIYKLMESYAGAIHAQEDAETNVLLQKIHHLSADAYSQKLPVVGEFQKQIAIAHADIEKTLMALLNEGYEIKLILMSLFYFWFILAAPAYGAIEKNTDNPDPFSHMLSIIDLVKKTTISLPEPKLSKEIQALNKSMQQLKKRLPHPEALDNVPHEKALSQTEHINTAIHTVTCDLFNKNIHIEAVMHSLFSHWLRLSVFFGISESEWQKMDYYFPDIMKAVKNYLASISLQ